MKKYNFNLIEIMLAVVILALGMTSVFVLFPAGLNNHKTAMAENSFADLAELIVSHVRAKAALSSNPEKFSYDLGTSSKTVDYTFDDNSEWDAIDENGTLMQHKSSKGTYLVRHLSGPADNQYTDFAAIARVYKDDGFKDELIIPFNRDTRKDYSSMDKSKTDVTGNNNGDLRELDVENFVIPMVLEISYPADRPYDDREKVYFRFEIFNESFEQIVRVTP